MSIDINSIRRTTEQGIPQLADAIFSGVVDEQIAYKALFKGLHTKLTMELERRRADEALWIEASQNNDLKLLNDYREAYDNEAPEYKGRHVEEAKKLIVLIENDDVEWLKARSVDSIELYKDYLNLYDNSGASYYGKYIEDANKAIKAVKDREDWANAKKANTIRSYSAYLSVYDKTAPDYVGQFVNEAKFALFNHEDEADWQNACSINSIESYKSYLNKYEQSSSQYRGKYIESAKQRIQKLLPPPPPDPRIVDEEAWNVAIKANTIEAYTKYLDEFDNSQKSYKGIHVKDAKLSINKLQDELDWISASSEDTIVAYQRYLSTYNDDNGYKGKHIVEAHNAIERLTPPNPRVEDDAAWEKATRLNTIDGYRQYLSHYKIHANEAEIGIRHLIDEMAWKEAKGMGTKAAYEKYLSICKVNEYPGYVWTHINAAKSQIGNLVKAEETKRKEEERQRIISEDNAAWDKARKANSRQSYEEYLAKYKKAVGLHVREAENAILRLQSEEDWHKACSENTLNAYKRFVDRYEPMANKYMSIHLPEAKKKIKELTPVSSPIKWKKWFLIVIVLALCWFLWIQWQDDAWPFNIFNETPENTSYNIVEEIDSLQWAIDNHDIPMLTKYANMDSVSAFYPLSVDLWSQRKDTLNSLRFVRKALNAIDSNSKLYGSYTEQLEILKQAIGYYETIAHELPELSSDIGERLTVLAKEVNIIDRAKYISQRFDFPYSPNPKLLEYIEDDFRRWVAAGDGSPVLATKEDCYKAALQLKKDASVREKLSTLHKYNGHK